MRKDMKLIGMGTLLILLSFLAEMLLPPGLLQAAAMVIPTLAGAALVLRGLMLCEKNSQPSWK